MRKKTFYVNDMHASDKPVIVLLHGFLASKGYWKIVRAHLSPVANDVIAIDLLGFGKAPKSKYSQYTYDDHIAHIHGELAELELKDRKLILVGHSMGAMLAARYSLTYPKSVKRLVLLNPPLYTGTQQAKDTLRQTGALYRILLDSRFRHALWIVLRNVGPISKHTKFSRESSLKNIILLSHFLNDLAQVSHPTKLIVGTKDRKIYLENLAEMNLNNNIELIFMNAGHHAPKTRAVEVAEIITELTKTHS